MKHGSPGARRSPYPLWFFLPAAVIYGVLFLVPTIASLWFSLTRWDLTNATFNLRVTHRFSVLVANLLLRHLQPLVPASPLKCIIKAGPRQHHP